MSTALRAQRIIDECQAEGCSPAKIRQLADKFEDEKTKAAILQIIGKPYLIKCPSCGSIRILVTHMVRVVESQDEYGLWPHQEISAEHEFPHKCQDCAHFWWPEG